MDNVNHLNELSIQSQLSILEKLVADAEQSTDARQTSKSKREIEKSLCTNWWSQPKRRRVSPLRAQYIVVSNLHIMTRTPKLSRKRYLS